jgi:hypothetical protein
VRPLISISVFVAVSLTDALPSDPPTWERMSVVGLLALAVTAFLRGWIVPGSMYTQAIDRADKMAVELRASREREIAAMYQLNTVLAALQTRDREPPEEKRGG